MNRDDILDIVYPFLDIAGRSTSLDRGQCWRCFEFVDVNTFGLCQRCEDRIVDSLRKDRKDNNHTSG